MSLRAYQANLRQTQGMVIIAVPPLVMLIGLLMYALCTNPKLAEIGRILFFAGALATCLMCAWAHPLRMP